MNIEIINSKNKKIAVVTSQECILKDVQSALDLIADVSYNFESNLICIDKNCVLEDFFVLSTGLAGEILEKFVQYNTKLSIYGDYSSYTSKPLLDFIYESNGGNSFFFLDTLEESIDKLSK